MLNVIILLVLFSLTLQLFPVALGINYRELKSRAVAYAFILILGQVVLFLLGYMLGERFLYLVEGFKGTVIFIGFSLIGIRMVMEAFQVRKGVRTFVMDNVSTVTLASVAQAVNTFLAGMLLTYLPVERNSLSLALFLFALIVSFTGVVMKPNKEARLLSSLFFMLSGVVILFSGLYLGFFN